MMGSKVHTANLISNGNGVLPFDPWMADVTAEFRAVAGNAEQLPYSAPLAEAILMNLEATDDGQRLLRILHDANPERPAPEAYRLIRSGYVAQLLKLEGASYPDDYTTLQSCLRGIRRAQTTFPYAQRLNEIFRNFDLSTTVWPRYSTTKFLGQMMMHRTGPERKRADIGCADFTGSTAVLMSDIDPEFSFSGVEVLEKVNGLWVVSKGKSYVFADVVSQPDQAGVTIGVDRVNPKSPIVADFIEGSMTPEELHKGVLPSGHRKLLQTLHSGVFDDKLKFAEADITSESGVNKVLEAAGGLLDEAYIILAWHQGTAKKRRQKFNNMHKLVSPEKPVTFVDFVRRDTSGEEPYLSVLKKWTCGLNVVVSLGGKLYKPMQWTDGRCRQVKIFPDLQVLAEGGPFEEQARELVARFA